MRQTWILLLLLAVMAGCVSPEEAPPVPSPQAQEQAIINGDRDFARQAVVAVAGRQSICSGTIVQTDPARGLGWVLTAAHCVEEPPVAVLQGNNYENPDETYAIVDYLAHPAYDSEELSYDFAVVLFSGATANTPIIPIQTSADGLSAGDEVTSVGYGRTTPSDQADTGNSLRYQIDRVLSDFTDSQTLVYSLSNGGICQGDSGGPVLALYNGVERVVAVHSAVTSECRGLGLSARVSAAYDSWIRGQLTGEVEETCDLCSQTAWSNGGACSQAVDACFNNSRCAAFSECINNCSTETCTNNCASTYSDALDLYRGLFDCVCEDACPQVCGQEPLCASSGVACGFQFQDTSCNGCMESACCSQAQRCADDNNCFDCLGGEGNNCGSNAALSSLSTCLEDNCAEACGIEQPACGFTADGACGSCLEGSCCAQGAACGEDSLCSSCLTDADADPGACAANSAYNNFLSCLGTCNGDPCGVGSEDTNNGEANNGDVNNTNNGDANNGDTNNGEANNGEANNGDVNNSGNNGGSFVNNGDGSNNGDAQDDEQDGFVDGSGGGSEVSTCAVSSPAAPASAPWGLLLLGLLLGLARRRA